MSITFANIITNTENRRIGSKFNVKIVLRRLIDVSDLCACALLSDIDSNQIGHIFFLLKLWIVCFAMRHCTEKKKWKKCVFKKSNCLKCVAFKEAWKIVWVFFFFSPEVIVSMWQCAIEIVAMQIQIQKSLYSNERIPSLWSSLRLVSGQSICGLSCVRARV